MIKLLFFHADWCKACPNTGKVVKELAEKLKIELVDIDVGKNTRLSAKYGVSSLPTVIIENNDNTKRLVGSVTRATLRKVIDEAR